MNTSKLITLALACTIAVASAGYGSHKRPDQPGQDPSDQNPGQKPAKDPSDQNPPKKAPVGPGEESPAA